MAYETINTGTVTSIAEMGKITIAPITWHHTFEIGNLLKEKSIDNGFVVLVVGLACGWIDSYDIMIVRTEELQYGQPYSVGDIIKNIALSPERWERIDV